jgi:hypothetical protein
VAELKVLGWLYNEDGIWVGSDSRLRQSFVRTNDDAVRLYAGALDGFRNRPGPARHTTARDIRIEDMVVQQLFNGGVIQLGWEDAGIQDSRVSGLAVVGAEWYRTSGLQSNDAVVSLRPPVYDVTLLENHRNLTIENITIDASVGRVVGLGLGLGPINASAGKGSSLRSLTVSNVQVANPLRWFPTTARAPAEKEDAELGGGNFLAAAAPSVIAGVVFDGIVVAGVAVRCDADWGMNVSGAVAGVSYGDA